jgi:hypothetical protein
MKKVLEHAKRLDREAQTILLVAAASAAATSTAASAVIMLTHEAALGQLVYFYDTMKDFDMEANAVFPKKFQLNLLRRGTASNSGASRGR